MYRSWGSENRLRLYFYRSHYYFCGQRFVEEVRLDWSGEIVAWTFIEFNHTIDWTLRFEGLERSLFMLRQALFESFQTNLGVMMTASDCWNLAAFVAGQNNRMSLRFAKFFSHVFRCALKISFGDVGHPGSLPSLFVMIEAVFVVGDGLELAGSEITNDIFLAFEIIVLWCSLHVYLIKRIIAWICINKHDYKGVHINWYISY